MLPSVPPGLRLSLFDFDATPPVGTQLAYDPEKNTWDLGLRAKGIVIFGAGQPIVLCAVDWLCISNGAHDAFRRCLADAAGTTPGRVAVHTVHQHDALWCDFSAEKILIDADADPGSFEGTFARAFIRDLAVTVRKYLSNTVPVTHLGHGSAKVKDVASNRRILDANGKVRAMRWTATPDSALRAEPEGVIDPEVSLVSFWNNDKPVAVLSYYASHPQSYYRTGIPNPDFPGIARFLRQMEVPDALHVHFTGAGANVGAGKYNDGSHVNRMALASRLADGMKRAWESTVREPLTPESVSWSVESVSLPTAGHLDDLKRMIAEVPDTVINQSMAARLAWIRRNEESKQLDLTCLSLGRTRILHLPGELFVEYQLAAKATRKDLFVTMAAYGDCGTGYIGTSAAYDQGGYETGVASYVGPGSETIIMSAIRKLLADNP
ncbi:MAG: hypothetical protein IQL11_09475 [Bacteroidales bacterium]|nr:hypothetical protein [Bacteroidales bacterium]